MRGNEQSSLTKLARGNTNKVAAGLSALLPDQFLPKDETDSKQLMTTLMGTLSETKSQASKKSMRKSPAINKA